MKIGPQKNGFRRQKHFLQLWLAGPRVQNSWISLNQSWTWSWGIPHNLLKLMLRFGVLPILVQGSSNWPNYDRKWSLEKIWNGSIHLESLRVRDRIKSKLGLDHCSQIFFDTYSRLSLYSCPTRALLETLYLQVCYRCLIYKCKIVFVACNEIAFCFICIVGSLGTVAQGNDSCLPRLR